MKLKCERCGGTGIEVDQVETGSKMRALRVKRNLQMKTVAARMYYSESYLSDLELGKRSWSAELLKAYKKALR